MIRYGLTTLLKIRLLSNEKIVAELVEKPAGCWQLASDFIRHVQLTTRRVNYSESYRKQLCYGCFTVPPSLRHVFLLRDISEIWAKQLLNVVMFVLLSLGGAAGVLLFG